MARLTRRAFMARTAALAAASGAASCTDRTDSDDPTGTDGSGDTSEPTDTEPPLPPWCDVQAGTPGEGWVPVALADHPGLSAVGGWTAVRLEGQLVNIAQVEDGCFVAMGTVCTHEGCVVEVRDNPGPRFVCPCHGALYDWEGMPVAGPAPDALPTWPAALRDGSVWVRIR